MAGCDGQPSIARKSTFTRPKIFKSTSKSTFTATFQNFWPSRSTFTARRENFSSPPTASRCAGGGRPPFKGFDMLILLSRFSFFTQKEPSLLCYFCVKMITRTDPVIFAHSLLIGLSCASHGMLYTNSYSFHILLYYISNY